MPTLIGVLSYQQKLLAEARIKLLAEARIKPASELRGLSQHFQILHEEVRSLYGVLLRFEGDSIRAVPIWWRVQMHRRRCSQDGRWYNLPETIEFVFGQGGSLLNGMRLWDEMKG